MADTVEERDATIEDFQHDILTAQKNAIFHRVGMEVLRSLLPGAKIRTVEKNDILFTQGTDSRGQFLYILLDAVFSVTHIISGYPLKIAEDQPGVIAADVENFVRDIPASIYGRQQEETNSYLSTVACIKGGKVLLIPEANICQSNDFQLAWNLGTALAIKLVKRNMPTDSQLTEDHDRIVGFLCENLKKQSARAIERIQDTHIIRRFGRRVDLVEDMAVTYYDIREFVYRYDLNWEGREIRIPKRVFDMLMNDPVRLPVVGKSRIEMYEWRKSLRKQEEATESKKPTEQVVDNA